MVSISADDVYFYLKGFPPNGKQGLKNKRKKADPLEKGYLEGFHPTFNDLRQHQK